MRWHVRIRGQGMMWTTGPKGFGVVHMGGGIGIGAVETHIGGQSTFLLHPNPLTRRHRGRQNHAPPCTR